MDVSRLPKLAMVSTDIRRDLIDPLRHLRRMRLVHFYRRASYGDLVPGDIDSSLVQYSRPSDLFFKLMGAGADIVQGVEPFAVRLLPYLYAVFAASLRKKLPFFLVTLENRPLNAKHGPVAAAVLRELLRPVMRRAAAIVCLNEGARRNVLSVGQFGKKVGRLMYGTWGVDPEEFTPQTTGEEPDFGPGPVIMFVGRLDAEKGVFDLLSAFDKIKASKPGAKIVMIGEGPARGEIERLISGRDLAGRVMLIGTVKNRQLPPYYRSADVFVAPSVTTRKWEEQVGMTNLQAMSSGLPVVSTRSGAIPEYVSDGISGLLAPEGDPQELAAAILRVLDDAELRRRLGQAARAQVISRYDARRNVLRAEELILSLLKES